ncbi:MAG: hypothetical protein N3E36_01140 [Sulfolobales archaeon]|nr:hypothetical protein [Sulfolobales archaeon]MCX8198621.1 hypothetical protein [Sulfolobales archaeon]MDW8169695.1 hypothetical protein [Desulfurococcaceae archaeon]
MSSRKKEARVLLIHECGLSNILLVYRGESVEELSFTCSNLVDALRNMKSLDEVTYFASLDAELWRVLGGLGKKFLGASDSITLIYLRQKTLWALCKVAEETCLRKLYGYSRNICELAI